MSSLPPSPPPVAKASADLVWRLCNSIDDLPDADHFVALTQVDASLNRADLAFGLFASLDGLIDQHADAIAPRLFSLLQSDSDAMLTQMGCLQNSDAAQMLVVTSTTPLASLEASHVELPL